MAHIYTAHAEVSGGRNGHGRSDDGHLDVDLRRPGVMGGEGGATNPEQLFAVGYGACFEGALATAARRQRVDVGTTAIDAMVELHSNDDGSFRIEVALDVEIPTITDAALARALALEAHRLCPYSNALRGNVDVALSVNGEHLAGPQ